MNTENWNIESMIDRLKILRLAMLKEVPDYDDVSKHLLHVQKQLIEFNSHVILKLQKEKFYNV